MMRLRRLLLAALLVLPLARAAETPLPQAQDFPKMAAQAGKLGYPVILLVSLTDCVFCEKIRREHLVPLLRTGVPVWQIHLDTDLRLTGFDGKPVIERDMAKALNVRVAPSVFFFDSKGNQLTAPLIGTMLDDFYSAYLDDAISTSRKKLGAR